MFISISSKIIALIIALVLLCASGFLLLSMREHEGIYKNTLFSHISISADNLAQDLLPLMDVEQDRFEISSKLLNLGEFPLVSYALVYDKSWRLVEQYYSESLMTSHVELPVLPPFNVQSISVGNSLHDGQLVSLTTIGDESYILGYLLIVCEYQKPLTQSNWNLIVNSMPLALGILTVMFLVAVWLGKYLLRPLTQLTEFTQKIKNSSNYSQRFEHMGHDEVSFLSDNINAMLSRIEHQDVQHQKFAEDLIQQRLDIEHMGNFDALTNLPNRKFFMDVLRSQLVKAKRNKNNLMVLFLDLDHFKSINDSLGHKAGDELLLKVVEVIKIQLREEDVLARLSGDKFLILLTDVNEDIVYIAIKIAERIIKSLENSFEVMELTVQTGVSIGIADAISSEYSSESIISNADIAMYQAKEMGRNTYALFKSQLHALSLRRMLISNALVKALEKEEFEIHYQAKVGINNQVNGLEALIRWKSCFDGAISPQEFIPVAEKSGRIMAISRWVISHVFRDFQAIQKMSDTPIIVSLNLSAYDVSDEKLVPFIITQLQLYSVNPQLVEFEITESAYLDNFDKADTFFSQIRQLGFLIALDDFGTGYSSMSYLTRLDINTLKIDQYFVKSLDSSDKDKLIIDSIIGLAHKLKLNVCAEGVETIGQKEYLIGHGCEQMQGYYYSKPCHLNELMAHISEINGHSPLIINGVKDSNLRG